MGTGNGWHGRSLGEIHAQSVKSNKKHHPFGGGAFLYAPWMALKIYSKIQDRNLVKSVKKGMKHYDIAGNFEIERFV